MKNRRNLIQMMERFESLCKARGLRMTHQRMEIFREMARYPGHPTVEMVFKRVRKGIKTISLDTVYRTITTFEELGFVRRIRVFDNSARYDINLSVHHHLVCTHCKTIEDFYWDDFDQMELPEIARGWGDINSKHAEIRGLCRKCRRKFSK